MFWSVGGHRGWCQNGLSFIDAHHHRGHHNHHHHDKHNGVDPICDFLLVCAKGLCCLLPSPETAPSPTLKGVARYSIGRSPQQYYGGRSAVRPGRESALGDRERHLPRLCRLLQETESRGVGYGAGVYQHHYRIRSFRRQQPISTAMSKPKAVHLRDIGRPAVAGF